MIKKAAANDSISLDKLRVLFCKITSAPLCWSVSLFCSVFKALLYFFRMKQCGQRRLSVHSIRIPLCNQKCAAHDGYCYWRNVRGGRGVELDSSPSSLPVIFTFLVKSISEMLSYSSLYYCCTATCETATSQEHRGHRLSTRISSPVTRALWRNLVIYLCHVRWWQLVNKSKEC